MKSHQVNDGKCVIVNDLLWGDGGKAKIAAHIAYNHNFNLAIRSTGGTNCGHSIYKDGVCLKTNNLPLAAMFPSKDGSIIKAMIGAGCMVDLAKVENELRSFNFSKYNVYIDKLCSVITDEHKQRESNGANYSEQHTGSTKSGTGEARVDRVRRVGTLIKDIPGIEQFNWQLINARKFINEFYKAGGKIIIEGAQSYYLSLNHSDEYPVVTSDCCTPMACADGCGLAWNNIDEVVSIIKSAPTRVSQGCGILPGEISKEEALARNIQEYGVTSGRPRRKSLQIPWEMLVEPMSVCAPTCIALTFCDHVDKFPDKLPAKITKTSLQEFEITYSNINKIEQEFKVPVKYIEYGKEFNQITEIVK